MRKSTSATLAVVVTLFAASHARALSIVSDYWPLTDEQQPDSCVYISAPSIPEVVTPVEVSSSLGRRCMININHLNAGTYSAAVFARNAAMDSFAVQFEFTVHPSPAPGALTEPVGLRCEPNTCVVGE